MFFNISNQLNVKKVDLFKERPLQFIGKVPIWTKGQKSQLNLGRQCKLLYWGLSIQWTEPYLCKYLKNDSVNEFIKLYAFCISRPHAQKRDVTSNWCHNSSHDPGKFTLSRSLDLHNGLDWRPHFLPTSFQHQPAPLTIRHYSFSLW